MSVATAQRVDRVTVGAFFSMMKNEVTEVTLSGTPGNIFNVNGSGIQVNNPDTVITDKGHKNI
jgi:hypothetical protein